MKIYKSSNSKSSTFSIYGTILFLIIVTISIYLKDSLKDKIIITTVTIFVVSFLIAIIIKTQYSIKNNKLYWQSGFFYGNIAIKNIIKIEYHKGFYVPVIWKPALNHKGLIITYNKFDDIYISPKQEKQFINELLKVNSQIELIDKKI